MARIKPFVYLGSEDRFVLPEHVCRELTEVWKVDFTEPDFDALSKALALGASIYRTRRDATDHLECIQHLENIAAHSAALHELLKPVSASKALSAVARAKRAALRYVEQLASAEPLDTDLDDDPSDSKSEDEGLGMELHLPRRGGCGSMTDAEFFEHLLSQNKDRALLDRCHLDLSALQFYTAQIISRVNEAPLVERQR